jgi:UDP-N-acetylmuramate--alanine ligase
MADEVILLPIYPARELPIKGISSEMILNKMKNTRKKVLTKEQLMNWIRNDYLKNISKKVRQVLMTAGAGDIDMLVEPIKQILNEA